MNAGCSAFQSALPMGLGWQKRMGFLFRISSICREVSRELRAASLRTFRAIWIVSLSLSCGFGAVSIASATHGLGERFRFNDKNESPMVLWNEILEKPNGL